MPRLLDDLLRDVDITSRVNPDRLKDLEITTLVADSRIASPGSLFFAIAGHQNNGLEFVTQALEKGAVAVVANDVSGVESSESELPIVCVPDVQHETHALK